MRSSLKAVACAGSFAALLAIVTGGSAAAAAEPEGVVVQANQPTPGGYVVALKDGTRFTAGASAIEQASASLVARYGGELKSTFTASMHGFAVRGMTEAQARRLAADPAVGQVFQDGTARVADTQTGATYGIDRTDQRDLPLDQKYTYNNTAADVTAYILDTGIRYSHNEFEGRAKSGYDFVDTDPDANDCNGHGTHVSGTVGGKTWGLAKKVKLVGVKVLGCGGSAPDSDGIEGIEWVTKNAVKPAVANMSLTFDTKNVGDQAMRGMVAAGVTTVVAAGNSGADACNTGPAYLPEVITAGATDASDNRASFSNYGTCVDLFAPGNNITSASNGSDSGSTNMSGTSMASPHGAGVAALYLQANKSADPAAVSKALTDNATAGKVKNPGSGSPNKLLYSGFVGSGPGEPSCEGGTNGDDVAIPDAGAAVSSAVTVSGCDGKGSAASSVEVAIKHPYTADLKIDLIAPSGAVTNLKQPGGASTVDLGRSFSANTSAENRNGIWKLQVTDVYAYDSGSIDSFGIKF
ncbi:S8 family peptidase [Amycolatopsis nigrescens]|uniref:S8 family peptidase n=1 Tax=Amycolatopsis nigrescens TaxID=381445 RepID=UPI00036A10AB|nr:S8 family serine peptidase [Amycolatopsis nigrescens]